MMKILIRAGILFVGLYAGAYVFNHGHPWWGISIALLSIILTLYLIVKKK